MAEPRVHLYAACWNEADMLGFFFAHHDPWVERYVIFDDGSTDGSLDLLAAHPRVEVRRLVRTRPDSLVLSLLDLYEDGWKESRGAADWVAVVNVDEQLHHPDLPAYLQDCRRRGVTAIPALGFQMVDDGLPQPGVPLAAQVRRGTPWAQMSKLALFDPGAVDEIRYAPGRHTAAPTGDVRYPEHDELLCLHFECLGLERMSERHRRQGPRLLAGDRAAGYGHRYVQPPEETARWVAELRAEAVEPLAAGVDHHATHPAPRWWR